MHEFWITLDTHLIEHQPKSHNVFLIPNITYLQSLMLWIYTLHAWLIWRWIYDICLSLLSSPSSPPMQTTLPSTAASQWPPRHHQRRAHPDTEGRPCWHTTVCWGTIINLRFDFWCDDDDLPWEDSITKFSTSAIKKVCYPLQFLLPLIIEKLDSDVQSAKLDSLQTLVRKICATSKMCLWWYESVELVV